MPMRDRPEPGGRWISHVEWREADAAETRAARDDDILPVLFSPRFWTVSMNYNAELQRLKRLLHTDYKAYLDELHKPWSGMEDDLDVALKILLKHAAKSGGQLPLLEACHILVDSREEATVTLPQWWFEIITTFKDLYAPPEAEYRAQKVLNELIGKKMGREDPTRYH